MATRPYKYKDIRTSFFYYPVKPEDYQRLFIKMEIFSDREQNRTSDTIIYLPLPLGLLREESATQWGFDEFEIMGEAGKAVADYVNNSIPFSELAAKAVPDVIPGLTGPGKSGFDPGTYSKAFNTFLEKELQNTKMEAFEAIRAGAGYARKPNVTFIFQNINNLRDFRLDWKLHPKSVDDARMAEKIISEIQKAALPSVSDMSAYKEIGFFTAGLFGVDHPENDAIGKGDVVLGTDFEHKLYSTTYRSPKEFKLSVVERKGKSYGHWETLENIVDFPIPFVLQDYTFHMGGDDIEADTFVREGDEFFTASYLLSLGYVELTHYKASDVQDYRTFREHKRGGA